MDCFVTDGANEVFTESSFGHDQYQLRIIIGAEDHNPKCGSHSSVGFSEHTADFEVYALLCRDFAVESETDVIGKKTQNHGSGSVQYIERYGSGTKCCGDREFLLNLDRIPLKYDGVIFMGSINFPAVTSSDFSRSRSFFLRVIDEANGKTVIEHHFKDGYAEVSSVLFCELERNTEGWRFTLNGEGVKTSLCEMMAI